MNIIAVYPLGKYTYIVRRGCGYYVEVDGATGPLDQDKAHKLVLGTIPEPEHRQGSTASGVIEVK